MHILPEAGVRVPSDFLDCLPPSPTLTWKGGDKVKQTEDLRSSVPGDVHQKSIKSFEK